GASGLRPWPAPSPGGSHPRRIRPPVPAERRSRLPPSPRRRHSVGTTPGPALGEGVPMSALHEPVSREPVTAGSEMVALLGALTALQQGRTGVRLPPDWTGVAGKVADAFNEVVELNERMAEELGRLRRVVGKEGKLSQRLTLGDVSGFWQESVVSVNDLIDDLVHPTSETARVIGAVAQGNLSQTMALEVGDRPLQGEFLRT